MRLSRAPNQTNSFAKCTRLAEAGKIVVPGPRIRLADFGLSTAPASRGSGTAALSGSFLGGASLEPMMAIARPAGG